MCKAFFAYKHTHIQSVILQQSMGKGSMRLPALTTKMNIIRPTVQAGLQDIINIKYKLQSTRQQLRKSIRMHNEQMNEVYRNSYQLIMIINT